MSHIPQCKHCQTKYEAYSEQQVGFAYDILIKVWVCPSCGHRKSLLAQEEFEAWDNAKRYSLPQKKNNDFESIYKNPNKLRGVPGTITKKDHHGCGDDCKCGDDGCGGCNGGCGSCGH